jgi:peptide/nickel transport system substrate-binding protein
MKVHFKHLFLGMLALVLVWGFIPSDAAAQEPQYGGTLRMITMYPHVPPMSWDNKDWNWKHAHDTGLFLEHLMVGNLQKGPRGTNEYGFQADAWWPAEFLTGELAESWKIEKKPLRVVFKLRKGIYWQEKPGIMKAREFVADDVVYSMQRIITSPKAIKGYIDSVDRWEKIDKHTVALYLKHWDENWWYNFGNSYYAAILPKEMAEAGATKWQNMSGTGPYMLANYETGSSITSTKNPNYWGKEMINGKAYKLPFTDTIKELLIRDEASRISALRTGQVDLMFDIHHRFKKSLEQTCPQLQWKKLLIPSPAIFAMRMDTKPFDDIRVRRAMNLAINQQEIVDKYWEGNAELIGYPYPVIWKGYHTPLNELPPDVRELFTYNPEKAKKLLAEAGYPNGFTFTAMVSSSAQWQVELTQLLKAYLAKVGINMEIKTTEYPALLSALTSKTHTAGFMFNSGWTNPQACLRKNFKTKETWNPYMFSDPYFDKEYDKLKGDLSISDGERREGWKKLNVYVMAKAPAIWLPGHYKYIAWWPWVKNYYGELAVGCMRPGPIWARIWIDQAQKKKMGF